MNSNTRLCRNSLASRTDISGPAQIGSLSVTVRAGVRTNESSPFLLRNVVAIATTGTRSSAGYVNDADEKGRTPV